MTSLVLRRLLQAIPLLLLVSIVLFTVLHLVPGGPLAAYLENPKVRPEDIARLRAAMGLDRPLLVQYAAWLGAFVRGDWGYSFADGRPVALRIAERVPASLQLIGTAVLLAVVIAVPVGTLASVRRVLDRVTGVVAVAGISLPVFWFALIAQLVFAGWLGWLPSSGRTSFGGGGAADVLQHLVLPATVLAVGLASSWSRYVRRLVRETVGAPFIGAARARGVPERTLLWKHALVHALPTFVTVAALDAAMLASGAVVTESLFAWPGIGSLFIDSLGRRDYPVLMAVLMVGAAVVVLANLFADVAVLRLDPRSRVETGDE